MSPHCVMGHLKSSRSRALRKLVRTEKEGNAWGEAEIHFRQGERERERENGEIWSMCIFAPNTSFLEAT